MIQFVRFQLEVHHPHGVVEESAGAQAADWYQWKVHRLCLLPSLSSCYKCVYGV